MRLLGIDFETTGLDTANDRIYEVGMVLWDTALSKPLIPLGMILRDDALLEKARQTDVAAMMLRVSGVTPELIEEFGADPKAGFARIDKFCHEHGVDYLVAHNGENFDRPMLMSELTRHSVDAKPLRELPWIDTRVDIPFKEEPSSRRLNHLAADHGFLNPFPHRAVFDVLTMLKVLSHYPIDAVLEFQKIPFVTVRAVVSYEDRQLAKDLRYSWEKIGEKTFPKMWVKRVKENQLAAELEACKKKGFQAVQIAG